MKGLSRREFLQLLLGTAASLVLLRKPLRLLGSGSKEEEWEMPTEGRLSFISGEVRVNDRPAYVDDIVREGDVIQTGVGSEVEVELRDYAIFHLKENSSVRVENILASPKIRVEKGWFLIIVKRKTPLSVETPMTLAGVRGTVFFFKIISPKEEYMCICNGKMNIYNPSGGEPIKKITAKYHSAFDLEQGDRALQIIRAGLKHHEDEDILKMAERFPRESYVFRQKQEEGSGGAY
jgi:hypothetical protein